ARMCQNDQIGVIEFGADALVDRPVVADKTQPDLTSNPTTTYSNLADAIRLGLAVAPADSARRLVLLSDGKQNVGDAVWAARLASASGASIDVVPLTTKGGPEVLVGSLDAPKTVREHESVNLNI